MLTNSKNKTELFFPELSYKITGILFKVHNEIGPYGKEKQYADLIENRFKEDNIPYQRECVISSSGNITDFIVDRKIILELKTKRILTKEGYEQAQRYLQATQLRLCILVNFRNKYIKPTRVIKIDNVRYQYTNPTTETEGY